MCSVQKKYAHISGFFFIQINVLFFYELKLFSFASQRQRSVPAVSFYKCPQQPKLGHAKAVRWEVIHASFVHGRT